MENSKYEIFECELENIELKLNETLQIGFGCGCSDGNFGIWCG